MPKDDIFPNNYITLFNNQCYKGKPLFNLKWISKTLKYVHQVFSNGRFKSYDEILTVSKQSGPSRILISSDWMIET